MKPGSWLLVLHQLLIHLVPQPGSGTPDFPGWRTDRHHLNGRWLPDARTPIWDEEQPEQVFRFIPRCIQQW